MTQTFTLQNQADTQLALVPATPPAAPVTGWVLFVDSTDGNKLKAKASTGTVVTLATP